MEGVIMQPSHMIRVRSLLFCGENNIAGSHTAMTRLLTKWITSSLGYLVLTSAESWSGNERKETRRSQQVRVWCDKSAEPAIHTDN